MKSWGDMCYYFTDTIYSPTKVGGGMENARLILEIQNKYEERTREQVLANLNIAVALGKLRGMEVDRYRALPKVTNRSKHTVMSWFNRPDKRIPLVDLCMIAKYLKYNIFSFFTLGKDGGEPTTEDFLMANEYNNAYFPVDGYDIYIRAYDLQLEMDKDIVIDNLELFYGTSREILDHHSNERQQRIMTLTGCTLQTYYAWFNRSRKNVKIPLQYLCMMAIDCNTDLFFFFEDHNIENSKR